ncbi:LIM/homeobox protein Lhx9 [Elysia marginata]|uniref:LIM/homeobox protein Lhx9 n=1 Tax=Elysia marginata TaxID=1093978 RepID=A0AAV4FPU6_9GAST|nr:LIM/homeobox protein Lhx9 [Elysia marginata]
MHGPAVHQETCIEFWSVCDGVCGDGIRFAVKNCARCQQPISANELIMRAREQVFHLTCFACTACHRTLKSGEQYGLRDGLLYCRMDYELMFQGEFGLPGGHLSPGILAGGGGHLSPGGVGGGGGGGPGHIAFYNGVGAVQKGRPRKRKMQISDPDGCPPLGEYYSNIDYSVSPYDWREIGSLGRMILFSMSLPQSLPTRLFRRSLRHSTVTATLNRPGQRTVRCLEMDVPWGILCHLIHNGGMMDMPRS